MFLRKLFYGECDKKSSPNRRFEEVEKGALEKGVEETIRAYVKVNKKN